MERPVTPNVDMAGIDTIGADLYNSGEKGEKIKAKGKKKHYKRFAMTRHIHNLTSIILVGMDAMEYI
jgi:hypothetical protein